MYHRVYRQVVPSAKGSVAFYTRESFGLRHGDQMCSVFALSVVIFLLRFSQVNTEEMAHQVMLQPAHSPERFATHGTLVWFLPSMLSHVYFQAILLPE